MTFPWAALAQLVSAIASWLWRKHEASLNVAEEPLTNEEELVDFDKLPRK